MPNTKPTSLCIECGDTFPFRSNKRFCSPRCRKQNSQKAIRRASPMNAEHSPTTRRDQRVTYDRAMRLAEELYTRPIDERLGFMENLIQLARSGEDPTLARILTLPALLRPDPNKPWLFWRRNKTYCTIAQAANRYCRVSPWNASVTAVVRRKVPEPPTGEVGA